MLGQHEIAPGESTFLKIKYNTYKFPGKFTKHITIFTGSDGKQEDIITLTGEVSPIPMAVVKVDPRKIDAGNLAAGEKKIIPLEIQNSGDAVMKLINVSGKKSGTVFYDVDRDGPLLIEPNGKTTIELLLAPSQKGLFMEYVMIDAKARNVTDIKYKVVVVGQVQD